MAAAAARWFLRRWNGNILCSGVTFSLPLTRASLLLRNDVLDTINVNGTTLTLQLQLLSWLGDDSPFLPFLLVR